MLVHVGSPAWYYIEPTKTGTSTLVEGLPKLLGPSNCLMMYRKHWPILPPKWFMDKEPKSVITIRNPFSRAVSSWNHYCNRSKFHESISFIDWTERSLARRAENGIAWRNHNYEHDLSHPMTLWYDLREDWDFVLKLETLNQDVQQLFTQLHPLVEWSPLAIKNNAFPADAWKQHYKDRRAERNIKDLYQSDFERFAKIYPSSI